MQVEIYANKSGQANITGTRRIQDSIHKKCETRQSKLGGLVNKPLGKHNRLGKGYWDTRQRHLSLFAQSFSQCFCLVFTQEMGVSESRGQANICLVHLPSLYLGKWEWVRVGARQMRRIQCFCLVFTQEMGVSESRGQANICLVHLPSLYLGKWELVTRQVTQCAAVPPFAQSLARKTGGCESWARQMRRLQASKEIFFFFFFLSVKTARKSHLTSFAQSFTQDFCPNFPPSVCIVCAHVYPFEWETR